MVRVASRDTLQRTNPPISGLAASQSTLSFSQKAAQDPQVMIRHLPKKSGHKRKRSKPGSGVFKKINSVEQIDEKTIEGLKKAIDLQK